jgi:hypothetical protein
VHVSCTIAAPGSTDLLIGWRHIPSKALLISIGGGANGGGVCGWNCHICEAELLQL